MGSAHVDIVIVHQEARNESNTTLPGIFGEDPLERSPELLVERHRPASSFCPRPDHDIGVTRIDMSKLAIHNKFETALVPESASHMSDDPAFRRKRRDFHDTKDNGALRPWANSGVVYPTIHPCCDLL